MQQSIYKQATNSRQILWYLKNPTKTKDAEFIAMSLDDYSQPMQICKHILNVMGNYLKTVDTQMTLETLLCLILTTGYGKNLLFFKLERMFGDINQKTPLGFYLEGLQSTKLEF